jgi:XTP/dITP diphosphohydrolase
MPAPLVILVATQNPHKVQEIEAIFDRERVEGVTLRTIADAGFTNLPEPEELGTTFQENAVIKAVAYARATQHLCLADDSGLEIDALDGRPGVISSHYATDGAETGATRAQRDAANNARVLRELEGIDLARRTARFRCVMALARPLIRSGGTGFQPVQKAQLHQEAQLNQDDSGILHIASGAMEGAIGIPPRVPKGDNGFGYDPLFLVAPDLTKTGAELESSQKNAISHRAAAAKVMAAFLRDFVASHQ